MFSLAIAFAVNFAFGLIVTLPISDVCPFANVSLQRVLRWILLDQLLDLVLASCTLLLDCRKRYSRNSVIHDVARSFTVTLRIA